jgi:hypothetical protein
VLALDAPRESCSIIRLIMTRRTDMLKRRESRSNDGREA